MIARVRRLGILTTVCAATVCATPTVDAGYPVLSHFTRTYNGPYQPQLRRYVVVDPVDAGHAPPPPGRPHTVQDAPLWARRDAAVPTYPYGWFGARAATNYYGRGSYTDTYRDYSVLRGR